MQDWQQRVVDEHKELSEKINKLGAFVNGGSETFRDLDMVQQILMTRQLEVMLEYADILEQRIHTFEFNSIPQAGKLITGEKVDI